MKTKNKQLEGMLFGAFYGDAYSLGGHWVYDTKELENSSLNLSECNQALSSYHPTKAKGDFTHYGDQMFWLLEDLVASQQFSLIDYGQRWFENMSTYTGYVDGASKHTLDKLTESKSYFSCGSSSSDLSAISRIFPLIVHYNNEPAQMQEAIKLHTILTHMNKDLLMAGTFFSELTMSVLHGGDLEKAVNNISKHFGENVQKWVEQAQDALTLDTKEAIAKLGASCSVNGAFASTLYILLKYKDNFSLALKENLLAGGESAARGIIIGGVLGVLHSEDVLLKKEQINKYAEIDNLFNKIISK